MVMKRFVQFLIDYGANVQNIPKESLELKKLHKVHVLIGPFTERICRNKFE